MDSHLEYPESSSSASQFTVEIDDEDVESSYNTSSSDSSRERGVDEDEEGRSTHGTHDESTHTYFSEYNDVDIDIGDDEEEGSLASASASVFSEYTIHDDDDDDDDDDEEEVSIEEDEDNTNDYLEEVEVEEEGMAGIHNYNDNDNSVNDNNSSSNNNMDKGNDASSTFFEMTLPLHHDNNNHNNNHNNNASYDELSQLTSPLDSSIKRRVVQQQRNSPRKNSMGMESYGVSNTLVLENENGQQQQQRRLYSSSDADASTTRMSQQQQQQQQHSYRSENSATATATKRSSNRRRPTSMPTTTCNKQHTGRHNLNTAHYSRKSSKNTDYSIGSTSKTARSLHQHQHQHQHPSSTRSGKILSTTSRRTFGEERIDYNNSSNKSSCNNHVHKDCKSIAILGTMSNVGKSRIATAICRILTNGGTKCAPFLPISNDNSKHDNNNIRINTDGNQHKKNTNQSPSLSFALLPPASRRETFYAICEQIGSNNDKKKQKNRTHTNERHNLGYGQIGTAQCLQAAACNIVPRTEMNPIIVEKTSLSSLSRGVTTIQSTKENHNTSHDRKNANRNSDQCVLWNVSVMGKVLFRDTYKNLTKSQRVFPLLQSVVLASHRSLASTTAAELIVIQGSGSCSDLHRMKDDVGNLPLVRRLQCSWLLVADDENGGVFAQVIGTKMCVSKQDWSSCKGIIINKYNGLPQGLKMLQDMVKKPCYALPFNNEWYEPKEITAITDIDSKLAWEKTRGNRNSNDLHVDSSSAIKVIVVVTYPCASVGSELYALENDPRFRVEWRRKRLPKLYPATTAIILPGSRNALLDLKWLKDSGWTDFLRKHVLAGGEIIGLCAGYQMLGWEVKSDKNLTKQAIGLLPLSSTVQLAECKHSSRIQGQLFPSGVNVNGFEINCGFSQIIHSEQHNVKDGGLCPLLAYENGQPEGMQLGHVKGTYLYGILSSSEARIELLVPLKDRHSVIDIRDADSIIDPLDKMANYLQNTSGLDYKRLKSIISDTNTGGITKCRDL